MRGQSSYGLGGAPRVVRSDGTVIIEKLSLSLSLSLSTRVENLNLKKVIKVSYLNQESRQCFRIPIYIFVYHGYIT